MAPSPLAPRAASRLGASPLRTDHRAEMLDPTEFVQQERRLFIDTNVFMDTDARRAGGLKRLFERCQDDIARNGNPIVVPTKVVDELTKQSRTNPAGLTDEKAAAEITAATPPTDTAPSPPPS